MRYVDSLYRAGKDLFSPSKIIIDKYHFIRQVTWAIEDLYERMQHSMSSSLQKYYKRSQRLHNSHFSCNGQLKIKWCLEVYLPCYKFEFFRSNIKILPNVAMKRNSKNPSPTVDMKPEKIMRNLANFSSNKQY